jgi:hypothetical protein
MMKRRFSLACSAILIVAALLTSMALLSQNALALPHAWTDTFADESKIAQKSNVVISGGDVSLGTSGMNWYRHGVVIDIGPPGSSFEEPRMPCVLKGNDNIYRMWYTGRTSGMPAPEVIRYATSVDGKNWDRMGVVIGANASQEGRVYAATVIYDGGTYKMWYTGDDFIGLTARIFYATSPDGYVWTRQGMAVDFAFEGTYDTGGVTYPFVLNESGVYKMWYSGWDGAFYRVIYATSLDGLTWTSPVMVIDHGPPGSKDSQRLVEITIDRDPSGLYHAWYSAWDGSWSYLLNATSSDGIVWTKHGESLRGIPGTLQIGVTSGSVMILPDYSVWLWHMGGDGSKARVFLTIYTRSGHIVSEELGLVTDWGEFFSNKTDPNPDLFITYSVLDGTDWSTISGFWNLTSAQFSLASVDPIAHPSIRLRADFWDLLNNQIGAPSLHDWTVTFLDPIPPSFGGLELAVDDLTGGNVSLSWSPALDISSPITYNVYISTTSLGQDFGLANFSTTSVGVQITGLSDGTLYYFIVRAQDGVGNEESNEVEKSAMPTTPIDTTPPNFQGLQVAIDDQTGGKISLGWQEGSDPDTIECNSDPSLPLVYNIYISIESGGHDFLSSNRTTMDNQIALTGLQDGVLYYFVVRAEDMVGNEEENTVELSALPTTPIDTTPPEFDGLQIISTNNDTGDMTLTWNTAMDPDDPGCNSDPSLPIEYNIYMSESPTTFDFLHPDATTGSQQLVLSSLERGVTYYFVVRAEDAAGNEETNTMTKSAFLKSEDKADGGPLGVDEFWWIILVVIIILLAIIIAVLLARRGKKGDSVEDRAEEPEKAVEGKPPEEQPEEIISGE